MDRPLVSVIIPAYNAEGTIRRALDSVLLQEYQPLEIIVIDDSSADRTAELARSYAGVAVLSLARNGGECAAMNHGIAQARGELIAFLDADDEWLRGKLEQQVALLSASPRAAFVTCGCVFIGRKDRAPRIVGMDPPDVPADMMWKPFLGASYIAKPCVVARRSSLQEAGAFDPGLLVAGDQDMWIRLARVGEVLFLRSVLVNVHDTAHSLTKKYATRMRVYQMAMVRKHFRELGNRLTPRERRAILGQRYAFIGRNLYSGRSYIAGACYIMLGALLWHRPGENIWYLITASPPARWLKSSLRQGKARRRAW